MSNNIIGQKIVSIRKMTLKEKENEGWWRTPPVIELENGTILYPSSDEEGNGAGEVFGKHPSGNMFVLVARS